MQDVRVGIVGASPTGGWAHATHIPALGATAGLRLTAVSTSRPESAKDASQAYGVPGYHDFRTMAESSDVDLVAISVRVPSHAEVVRAALENDKHVFSEWPLAVDAEEARQLAELAASKPHLRTFIGVQGRHSPAVEYVRDLVRQGAIGELLATSLIGSAVGWGRTTIEHYISLFDTERATDPLTSSLTHALDTLMVVAGPIERMHGVAAQRNPIIKVIDTGREITSSVPDHVSAVGLLNNGALFNVYCRGTSMLRGSRTSDVRWELKGSDGDIVVSAPHPALEMYDASLNSAALMVALGRGDDKDVSAVEIPEKYFADIDPSLPQGARNIANMWAAIARDIQHGTHEVPDFAYAVDLHRLSEIVSNSSDELKHVGWPSGGPCRDEQG